MIKRPANFDNASKCTTFGDQNQNCSEEELTGEGHFSPRDLSPVLGEVYATLV